MKVKDGGAAISVEAAAREGAKVSKVIVELILMILLSMRKRNDSGSASELLNELDFVKDYLNKVVLKNNLETHSVNDGEVLSPAEKIYGVKEVKVARRKSVNSNDLSFDM